MKIRTRAAIGGFTLLELIVALFVTAVMFAVGYGALMQAVAQRDGITQTQSRLAEMQRALRIIANDIAQTTPRPVRDGIGNTQLPALQSEDGSGALLSLTRGGEGQALASGRTTLRRVQYRLEDGQLVRLSWPVLDPVQGLEPRRRELLSQVDRVELRYLQTDGQWQRTWPNVTLVGAEPRRLDRNRPQAVEVVIETRDMGRLMRLIEIP
jgi:general secretion pathway protein J